MRKPASADADVARCRHREQQAPQRQFLEEKDLNAIYGETYREHQLRVPMLLPLPKRHRISAAAQAGTLRPDRLQQ